MPDTLRALATAHAAQLLVELLAEADQIAGLLAVQVSDGTFEVRVQVLRSQQAAGGEQEGAAGNSRLTPLDHLILSRATREPRPMAWLAHRCGHESDSYFQARVRRLARLGRLAREFEGYRLPQ